MDAVVHLQMRERGGGGGVKSKNNSCSTTTTCYCEILVVTADGSFAVYTLLPTPKLQYKGNVLAPMNHMLTSTTNGLAPSLANCSPSLRPKLVRILLTDNNRLLLILSVPKQKNLRKQGISADNSSAVCCGSIHGFVYNRNLELWMRVSDGRFQFSDFCSSLPTTVPITIDTNNVASGSNVPSSPGLLSKIDDLVKSGVDHHHQHAFSPGDIRSSMVYKRGENDSDDWNAVVTRSHCEDRMACALALGSAEEFRYWIQCYVRCLSIRGDAALLRFVVDILLGKNSTAIDNDSVSNEGGDSEDSDFLPCWWISSMKNILDLDRKGIVLKIVIPEMSKNRVLQRLTNEIAMEMNLV